MSSSGFCYRSSMMHDGIQSSHKVSLDSCTTISHWSPFVYKQHLAISMGAPWVWVLKHFSLQIDLVDQEYGLVESWVTRESTGVNCIVALSLKTTSDWQG